MPFFKTTPTPPPLLLVVPPDNRSATEAAHLLRACLKDEAWQVLAYNGIHPKGDRPASSIKLTPKQLDVLRNVSEGKSNPKIAAAYGVSKNTVDGQIRRIFQKMKVNSREEAVAKGIREGLI